MRIRSEGGARRHGLRRLLAAMALVIGASAGALAAPLPAAAIPEGGWCYSNWYVFGSNLGEYQQPYGPTKHMDNQSSSSVQWSESISVSQTFSSTYTVNQTFSGGFDFGIVKSSVEYHTTRTTFYSITVNQTTGFQTTVPPHTLMYAQYGAYMLSTTGTYYQERYGCQNNDFPELKSGAVTVSSLLSVGWRIWEG